MPSLNSAIYQINSWTTVSSDLVDTVKDFVKAAIRTNPRDLLEWSRDYFRALSDQSRPLPDKDRWEETATTGAAEAAAEASPQDNRNQGISVGLLRLLHKQFGSKGMAEDDGKVSLDEVRRQWTLYGMDRQGLDDMIELVSMASASAASAEHDDSSATTTTMASESVDWNKLLALAAGQLGNSLGSTMETLCNIITERDDGGSTVPAATFIEMYTYLAKIDGDIPSEDIEAVVEYIGRVAQLQDDQINQFNLKSQLCPNLH